MPVDEKVVSVQLVQKTQLYLCPLNLPLNGSLKNVKGKKKRGNVNTLQQHITEKETTKAKQSAHIQKAKLTEKT